MDTVLSVYFLLDPLSSHVLAAVDEILSLFFYISVEGGIEGVAVGAILSDYQRVRVENVCARYGS